LREIESEAGTIMEIQRAYGPDMAVSAILPSVSPRVEQVISSTDSVHRADLQIEEQNKGQSFDRYA
jgi:hypothetical protein